MMNAWKERILLYIVHVLNENFSLSILMGLHVESIYNITAETH